MKRIIVDFKKLTPEILSLLVKKYPDGYDDRHIIVFKNARNQTIEAVEVPTEDCMYLVKVSSSLVNSMDKFDLDDYSDDEFNELIAELPDKQLLEEND
jgi:hypothetical protein